MKAKTAIIHTLISSPAYEDHKGAQIKLETSNSHSKGEFSNNNEEENKSDLSEDSIIDAQMPKPKPKVEIEEDPEVKKER